MPLGLPRVPSSRRTSLCLSFCLPFRRATVLDRLFQLKKGCTAEDTMARTALKIADVVDQNYWLVGCAWNNLDPYSLPQEFGRSPFSHAVQRLFNCHGLPGQDAAEI